MKIMPDIANLPNFLGLAMPWSLEDMIAGLQSGRPRDYIFIMEQGEQTRSVTRLQTLKAGFFFQQKSTS